MSSTSKQVIFCQSRAVTAASMQQHGHSKTAPVASLRKKNNNFALVNFSAACRGALLRRSNGAAPLRNALEHFPPFYSAILHPYLQAAVCLMGRALCR